MLKAYERMSRQTRRSVAILLLLHACFAAQTRRCSAQPRGPTGAADVLLAAKTASATAASPRHFKREAVVSTTATVPNAAGSSPLPNVETLDGSKRITEAVIAIQAISGHLETIRTELAKPPQSNTADYIQIGGLFATLLAAALSAYWSSRSAYLLARDRGREEKRQFCFELQTQFDAPQMFDCRYKAWAKLNRGDFAGIKTVSELLASSHWTYEVSTVIHFFESLSRYCGENLVDEDLAAKLFGRSYELWYQGVLGRMTLDAGAASYRDWFEGIRAFHNRVPSAKLQRPAPHPLPAESAEPPPA